MGSRRGNIKRIIFYKNSQAKVFILDGTLNSEYIFLELYYITNSVKQRHDDKAIIMSFFM